MKKTKLLAAALVALCTAGYAKANTGTLSNTKAIYKEVMVKDTLNPDTIKPVPTPIPKPVPTPAPVPPAPAPTPNPNPSPNPMPNPNPAPMPTPPTPTPPSAH